MEESRVGIRTGLLKKHTDCVRKKKKEKKLVYMEAQQSTEIKIKGIERYWGVNVFFFCSKSK